MEPAVLITQCLQNDFVKVIGSYEPLPNKLHIGYEEVMRLFGDKPNEGMLFNLMKWAYEQGQDDLQIINIRDWHDPNDPDQKLHLEQFGLHCIKDTDGAKFVFERIRNPEKDEIVNASGLNDFVDTSLANILSKYKNKPIRVGIIGVWTEAKVSFLAYELATRYPHFKISICSALTASSSTHMHYVSLDQLIKILDISIFSSITEFAQFLKGEKTTIQLEKSKDFNQAEFNFDEGTALDKKDIELLTHLFRNSKRVNFKVLDGGFSGNVVMKANSTDIHGHEELPTVIKIGVRNEIAHERDSFEKVQDVLGNNAPNIVGYLENEERAAIKYRYASMFDEKVQTFQQFYAQCNDQDSINNFLDVVFKKQLGRFYKAATLEQINLLEYYDFSEKYASSVKRKVIDLIGENNISSEEINIDGKKCFNLINFYEKDVKDLDRDFIHSHHMSYIHGDLNGANIIIDGRKNVWLIDFFHTHRGHMLKDLIKLENDVSYIFMEIKSMKDYHEACHMMDTLLSVEDLNKTLPTKNYLSPAIQKAYNSIRHIRSIYSEYIHFDRNPIQLFLGLLRYSVHTLSFEECTELQRKLALYTSCKLAEKIKKYVSQSRKLRIDYLPSSMNKIALTILPGRRDRSRNIEEDIQTIIENDFTSVVILLGNQELKQYGTEDLIQKYNSKGLKNIQLNIKDQSIPTVDEMHDVCDWIYDKEKNNEKVLLHCVGGIGRTGTTAACYLKKYKDHSTEEAIAEVRKSRSLRAIETKEQENFVATF